jgi:ABC-type transport system substrate-binding protein
MTRTSGRSTQSRRRFLAAGAAAVGAAAQPLLEACRPPTQPAGPSPTQPAATTAPAAPSETSAFGVRYPSDAAPRSYQFTQGAASSAGTGWKAMDFNEAVYARAPLSDLFTEPLVRLTKDFEIIPGQATRWEVSPNGRTWTFFLEKGLVWSDGNEVTAEDYVATFRYCADPKHAWDFTWYWSGIIKNFTEVTKGQRPASDLGVRVGVDKYQLVIETEEPTPFLPQMMLYSWPLSKVGLEKYGSGVYNTNPGTCISCGPYILDEWAPDRRIVVKPNPKYTGQLKPMVNWHVANVVSGGSDMARYQAGEVDTISISSPADVRLVQNDPALRAQLKVSPGDFRTFYLFFDVNTPPWDNQKVRLAFAKAIDRESIVKNILAPLALPAYSFLMPGFPDANSEGLKPIQEYNPEQAKRLLAEAGYPNGQGFPRVTLLVRGGGPATDPAVTQAVVASITQTLNVQIDLQTRDMPSFMADLNAKPTKIPFGWISYGMDYFDATNMLGVWLSGGRHSWKSERFDQLVKEGGRITDDPRKRSEMMKEAERILVEEAPGIFVYHQLVGQLHKPYRKGEHMSKNRFGYDGVQWPGEGTATPYFNTLYIGREVTTMRKSTFMPR